MTMILSGERINESGQGAALYDDTSGIALSCPLFLSQDEAEDFLECIGDAHGNSAVEIDPQDLYDLVQKFRAGMIAYFESYEGWTLEFHGKRGEGGTFTWSSAKAHGTWRVETDEVEEGERNAALIVDPAFGSWIRKLIPDWALERLGADGV